jgi:MbtH protein
MDVWQRPDDARYEVVRNDEDEYSIWLAHRPVPPGWTPVGKTGSKEECLAYIGTVWTDMRPRSLRSEREGQEP